MEDDTEYANVGQTFEISSPITTGMGQARASLDASRPGAGSLALGSMVLKSKTAQEPIFRGD